MRSVREMKVPAMQEADSRYVMVHVDPRDPDITEEAFQQTAILTLDRPKLSIIGGEGDTAQTVASKLEHWTEETFWQCGTRDVGADTMTQVTDSCLNDGGGWAKLLWATDLWQDRYAIPSPSKGETGDAWYAVRQADRRREEESGTALRLVVRRSQDGLSAAQQRQARRSARDQRDEPARGVPQVPTRARHERRHRAEELGAVTLPRDDTSGAVATR